MIGTGVREKSRKARVSTLVVSPFQGIRQYCPRSVSEYSRPTPLFPSDHRLTKSGLRESHIQYLYDLTFLYSAPGCTDYRAPSLDEQLSSDDLARAGFRYHIHVRRIPLDSLPGDTEGLKAWFEKGWGEKDEWLEKMTREGLDEKGDL